jgi:thiamine-monophosphate kinase
LGASRSDRRRGPARRPKEGLAEETLLARIRARIGPSRLPVLVGPGHDAALVAWPRGADLVLKTDQVVAGEHFDPASTPLDAVGRKVVARNLSDVAAFGGEPVAAVVSAALPRGFTLAGFDALLRGLLRACRESGTALVGGDLSRTEGPLVVSVTLAARLAAGRPMLRSGARPGDRILVTGRLGGSILGRHLRFRPRLAAGRELSRRRGVHAMMDVSDGLAKDLGRIARESGVAAVLRAEAVPVHPDARRLARRTGKPPLEHALGDGEDHELLFAASPRTARELCRRGVEGGRLRVTEIGRFRRGRGLFLVARGGDERRLADLGYEHRFE